MLRRRELDLRPRRLLEVRPFALLASVLMTITACGGSSTQTSSTAETVPHLTGASDVVIQLGDYVLNSFSPNTVEQYREYMKAIVAAGGSARTHPFVARNLRAWASHYAIRPNVRFFLLDGLRVQNTAFGIYHPDYDAHVYRDIEFDNVTAEPINGGHDEESLPVSVHRGLPWRFPGPFERPHRVVATGERVL